MKTIMTALILINLLACGFMFINPNIMYSVGTDQLDHIFDNLQHNQGISIDESRLEQMRGLENKYGLTGKKALQYTIMQVSGIRYAPGHYLGLWLLLSNTIFLYVLRFRNEKSVQQGGPGYPPQGVGSPDP